jgi:ceramide glucosyltransferase
VFDGLNTWLFGALTALAACASGYSVLVWCITRRRVRPVIRTLGDSPAVTILKPLCGVEPGTYECLRSFCAQDYPRFQVIFGVRHGTDPACSLVKRLQAEFPHRDLELVIDRRQHGSNRKVSNLINMMALARHRLLIFADADVRVPRDYLRAVVPPLLDPAVGIVTCPYRGIPGTGVWSVLGSMYINEWFMPSVRLAAATGYQGFASGVTIGIRAELLERIGGLASLANQLADDYRLGEATRRMGLRTVLSPLKVDTLVEERTFTALVRHEIRWLRTIRALRPASYASLFLTFGGPVCALVAGCTRGAPASAFLFAVTATTRILLHRSANRAAPWWQLGLVPLRDLLSVLLWASGFARQQVYWREACYGISREGLAIEPAQNADGAARETPSTTIDANSPIREPL